MAKDIEQILLKVQRESPKLWLKLTKKRQNILALLLQANMPLSAYDIADRYKTRYVETIPAMSVYRILNSLLEVNFAHKLKTTNQYLACSHITCTHEHGIPLFLICTICEQIEEIQASDKLISELESGVEKVGFTLQGQQIELRGICVKCTPCSNNI